MYVSKWIASTGAWEAENVQNLMKGVRAYKDAVFVGKITREDNSKLFKLQMQVAMWVCTALLQLLWAETWLQWMLWLITWLISAIV